MKNPILDYWIKTPELFSEKYKVSSFRFLSPTNLFLHKRRKKVNILFEKVAFKKVADIGCGSGVLMLDLINYGANVVGVDYSPKMLSSAEKLFKKYGIKNNKYKLIKSNVTKLPLSNKSVDLVLATGLLDYISKDDGELFMAEVRRVVNKNGNIIVSFPAKESRLSFLRSGMGLYFRQKFMKLPPIESVYSIEEIKKLLGKNSLHLVSKHKIMGVMWLVLANKR